MHHAGATGQEIGLLAGLDALCNDVEFQVVGDGQDGFDQRGVVRVSGCVLDEALVDLKFMNRQTFEISQ